MKHVLLGSLALALLGALLPAVAFGKGASEARITGPGLSSPIELDGSGEAGSGEQLARIAEDAGFFAAVFQRSPDPMLDRRPAGDLGPRYRIAYVMPGPNGESDTLVQDVYPYARPHAVTHMAPGQAFWDGSETRGGWYVASYSGLEEELVAAGVPSTPPRPSAETSFPVSETLAVGAVAAGLGVLAAIGLRRRPAASTGR